MNTSEIVKQMTQVFSNYEQAHSLLVDIWFELIYLTPIWWLGLLLGIFPWLIWWKVHNKNYTGDLFRAGLFMATVSLLLDSLGVQLGLWIYPYNIFPFIPGYFPWDLTLLPITMMLLIEIKLNLNPIYKGTIYSAFSSFIGEPLAIFFKLYEPLHWKNYYSFPIYILLFLLTNQVAKSKLFNSHMSEN
ncbi:CBO0543 family protein [Metabacillus litoralis]|uniref:CBO0543 family protein n=1 Tax=Metabacillus litoralis TaxID=152268 RepID=UPI000EF5BFAD|nr:CBO0543 family protein [Metabacillus litoralis]